MVFMLPRHTYACLSSRSYGKEMIDSMVVPTVGMTRLHYEEGPGPTACADFGSRPTNAEQHVCLDQELAHRIAAFQYTMHSPAATHMC